MPWVSTASTAFIVSAILSTLLSELPYATRTESGSQKWADQDIEDGSVIGSAIVTFDGP